MLFLMSLHMNLKLLSFVMVALLGSACSESNKSVTVQADGKPASSEKGIEVEYSYAQKNDFVAKLKEELSDVNRELEEMKAKAKNLDVEVNRAENATESTWNDVKASSKKAFGDMKEGFRDARQWTADKIAP